MKLLLLSLLLTLSSQNLLAEIALNQPVVAEESAEYNLTILSHATYLDQQGRIVVDIVEGDRVYFALSLETLNGQPVLGAKPSFSIRGTTSLIPLAEASPLTSTDESGIFEFGVIGGAKGLDTLTVSYGRNVDTLHLNVISIDIKNFSALPSLESGLSWAQLMQVELEYTDDRLLASFPSSIAQQAGDNVILAGYMLPLETDTKQRHFLLTSAPPSCFYHIPGGAAGVIEVFSEDGIEASWAAVTLEGRLKLIESSETGIIYQLEGAKLVDP